jgi:hypothetical protein
MAVKRVLVLATSALVAANIWRESVLQCKRSGN